MGQEPPATLRIPPSFRRAHLTGFTVKMTYESSETQKKTRVVNKTRPHSQFHRVVSLSGLTKKNRSTRVTIHYFKGRKSPKRLQELDTGAWRTCAYHPPRALTPNATCRAGLTMSSQFYIIHHTFKADKASTFWSQVLCPLFVCIVSCGDDQWRGAVARCCGACVGEGFKHWERFCSTAR
jgi:hypothetical protein